MPAAILGNNLQSATSNSLAPSSLRIAIVHDWLVNWRGGERVLETLLDLYPQADLYTLIADRATLPPKVQRRLKKTSWLQHIPMKRRFRYALPLFPWTVEQFRFDGYDIVVSISHTVAKGVRTGNVPHLCYSLTPMRYAWVFPEIYFGNSALKRWTPQGILIRQLQKWDLATAGRPSTYVAISKLIQQRIKKFYGLESQLIYPPVECATFESIQRSAGDAYLLIAALVPYKKTELAIEAFNRMKRPLVIVGTGPEEKRLRKLSSKHIRWVGRQSDQGLRNCLATARALIYPQEEDFGITAVEAQAAGCPVIAYGRGGATETIQDGTTGLFFSEQTPEALIDAVGRFETLSWDADSLRRQARRFDRSHFTEQFHEAVTKEIKKKS